MPLWLWHHIVHKIVAWPILKHDTDGAQNYLQWMVLHWEHTKVISQIFVVLPVCALHGILDIHSIHGTFYFTQAASLLQKIYKILQRTCITLYLTCLYSGLHSIFSPDLATEALELLLSITNEKKKNLQYFAVKLSKCLSIC